MFNYIQSNIQFKTQSNIQSNIQSSFNKVNTEPIQNQHNQHDQHDQHNQHTTNKPTAPHRTAPSKTGGEGLDFGNHRSTFGLKPKQANPYFQKGGVKKNTIFLFIS